MIGTLSHFTLNAYLNGILGFLIYILFIEGVLKLFLIKKPRIVYFFRLLAFLKLPLDLFFYNFSNWCFAKDLSVLNQPVNSRTLNVTLGWDNWFAFLRCDLKLNDGHQFTPLDALLEKTPTLLTDSLAFAFLSVSFLFIFLRMFKTIKEHQKIKKLISDAKDFPLYNISSNLKKYLSAKKIKILEAKVSHISPFTLGVRKPIIVLPFGLSNRLTSQELEAVLAHELCHIRYSDSLVTPLLLLIRSLFWCVPFLNTALMRLELARESACDMEALRFDIPKDVMSSAILKTVRHALDKKFYPSVMSLTSSSKSLEIRMQRLLSNTPLPNKFKEVYYVIILLLATAFIINSRLFIF